MKKYIAEFIGTFALVFCGTGAVVVDSLSNGSLGLLGISAVFGIVIMAMIYSLGNISGAHINPSVTIALALGKQMPKKDVLGYIVSQILGAFIASISLFLIFPETYTFGQTMPTGGIFPSIALEFILTFFLMLTILGSTSKKEFSNVAGFIIGTIVTGMILFAGPISGGSFNPARSLAPAIISLNLTHLWVYLLMPTLGTMSAMFVWVFLTKTSIKNN